MGTFSLVSWAISGSRRSLPMQPALLALLVFTQEEAVQDRQALTLLVLLAPSSGHSALNVFPSQAPGHRSWQLGQGCAPTPRCDISCSPTKTVRQLPASCLGTRPQGPCSSRPCRIQLWACPGKPLLPPCLGRHSHPGACRHGCHHANFRWPS